MSKDPLVSIIIPAWNVERYVKEAVDSALAQTYKNIEVIVVDDGSTDGTGEVLKPYARAGRIEYIFQKNKGLAGARNAGIRLARGEYVAPLDADDIFLPGKVAEQVAALSTRPDFGVCYSDLLHFTDETLPKTFHHRYRYPSGDIFAELLERQFLNPLTLLVRKDVFEKFGYFDENLRRSEDWDLWLRWAHAGVKFFYLDKILARYRIRSVGNLSAVESEPQMKEKNLEVFSRLGKSMSEEERQKYNFPEILDRLRLKTAFAYLMVGDKNRALAFVSDHHFWRFTIATIPTGSWKSVLGAYRRFKHRLLLKKL